MGRSESGTGLMSQHGASLGFCRGLGNLMGRWDLEGHGVAR